MAANRRIVERSDHFDDRPCKNAWRWEWVDIQVDKEWIGDCIRKIQKPGTALCVACDCEIIYGSRGAQTLEEHLKRPKHAKARKSLKNNTTIEGMFVSSSFPYLV